MKLTMTSESETSLYRMAQMHFVILNRLDGARECDRRTDGQPDRQKRL